MLSNTPPSRRSNKRRGIGAVGACLVLLMTVLLEGGPASAQQNAQAAGTTLNAATVASSTPARSTVAEAPTMGRKSAKRRGWSPKSGTKFNVARVGGEPMFRLEQQVIAAIGRARPGSTIKMSMFSFDRGPVADALIRAKQRKVHVQVLLNGHEFPQAQRNLSRVLGPRTVKKKKKVVQRKSFFYQCRASCRGDSNILHSKFILFSETGTARKVVMLGSVNMKLNGSLNQFNNLSTFNNSPKMFKALDGIFNEMRRDKVFKKSYRKFTIGKRFQLEVMPYPRSKATAKTRWTPKRDPIIRLLRPVKCTGARTDTGRTIVRVDMHAWDGARGALIANRFRQLYAAGCDVKIIVGYAGYKVRKIFSTPTGRGYVPIKTSAFDTNYDGEIDVYSHAKVLTVNGNYAGSPGRKMVVTGSSNYQDGGQYGDELFLRVYNDRTYRQFADHWGFMWRSRHTVRFGWGPAPRTRGIAQEPERILDNGLGIDSPEWRDE